MRKKIFVVLKRIYGIMMSLAFWGGAIPLLPFVIAIFVGGDTGEAIALFLYNQYYPWVIALASLSVLVGLAAMYAGKEKALSTETFTKGTKLKK